MFWFFTAEVNGKLNKSNLEDEGSFDDIHSGIMHLFGFLNIRQHMSRRQKPRNPPELANLLKLHLGHPQ